MLKLDYIYATVPIWECILCLLFHFVLSLEELARRIRERERIRANLFLLNARFFMEKKCKALFSYVEIYTFCVNQLRENQFTAINPCTGNRRYTINYIILYYISKFKIYIYIFLIKKSISLLIITFLYILWCIFFF